jgi:hypothetical protein
MFGHLRHQCLSTTPLGLVGISYASYFSILSCFMFHIDCLLFAIDSKMNSLIKNQAIVFHSSNPGGTTEGSCDRPRCSASNSVSPFPGGFLPGPFFLVLARPPFEAIARCKFTLIQLTTSPIHWLVSRYSHLFLWIHIMEPTHASSFPTPLSTFVAYFRKLFVWTICKIARIGMMWVIGWWYCGDTTAMPQSNIHRLCGWKQSEKRT